MDDYHFIQNSEIHASVSLMIKYLPNNAHLIMISRKQLPTTSIRMLTTGTVGENPAVTIKVETNNGDIQVTQ